MLGRLSAYVWAILAGGLMLFIFYFGKGIISIVIVLFSVSMAILRISLELAIKILNKTLK